MKRAIFLFSFYLCLTNLNAQTFSVGNTCCNYNWVNKTFSFPGTNGSFTDNYFIDLDGDLTNDIKIESFYFYCAPQPSGPCMGQWGRHIRATSTTSVEFICGPATSASCTIGGVIKNVPFGTVLNSSSNWTYTPKSSVIYSGDVTNPFCGQFANPFYIGFRKILASTDTIFGWIKMDSNYPGKVFDYAYTCGVSSASAPTSTILSTPVALCQGDSLTLVATPSGGQFSGQGVVSNKFKPATMLPGVYSVYYTLPNPGGCKYSAMQTMTVNAVPLVSFVGSPYIKCDTDTLIISGNPIGGTISYSGSGLSGNTFYCSVAGIGTHPISYSFTGTNGCSNSTTTIIQVSSCVGINEIGYLNSQISIYPNPANDKLNIQIGEFNNSNQYKFRLVSVEGKVVKSETLINSLTEIDVSGLGAGLYFIEFQLDGFCSRQKLLLTR